MNREVQKLYESHKRKRDAVHLRLSQRIVRDVDLGPYEVIISPDGLIVRASQALCDALQRSVDEIEGVRVGHYAYGPDKKLARQVFETTGWDGKVSLQVRSLRPDGLCAYINYKSIKALGRFHLIRGEVLKIEACA